MSDFFQNGTVTTLHNLTRRPVSALEEELSGFAQQTPMSLVLPSLFSELEGPALGAIIDKLAAVPYLDQIVIGLDRANEEQYRHALSYFSRLPQNYRVLWNDGPRLRALDHMLAEQGLAPSEPGKGRNVWFCFGYVLASKHQGAVALHDCDILTYERDLVARLFYPVVHPAFNYRFCKGYYSRIAEGKFNGRVARLLVTPLLRALKTVTGDHHYLDYLDSFRYALSGEFAMRTDVLPDLRIPSDWGLEIGVLSELHRNFSVNHLCQVDIADTYDHKHQEVSAEDQTRGLSRMSIDITKAVIRKLATRGNVFGEETFRTIKATYYRMALDFIESYWADATMNGLSLDRHREELTVELFAENIMRAGEMFLSNPMETPFMPSWNRVRSALPDIFEQLHTAVEEDMAQYR